MSFFTGALKVLSVFGKKNILSFQTGAPLKFLSVNWCSPKSSKCFLVSKTFWVFKLAPPKISKYKLLYAFMARRCRLPHSSLDHHTCGALPHSSPYLSLLRWQPSTSCLWLTPGPCRHCMCTATGAHMSLPMPSLCQTSARSMPFVWPMPCHNAQLIWVATV